MKREGWGPARADVLPAGYTFAPADLPDPGGLAARFGQAVRRAGGRPGSGWLYAGLHGEYSMETGLIDLHWHMLAAGSCLAAVESLRGRRAYRHARAVQVTRRPLTDLPRPLTYIRQSWLPARDRRLDNPPRERMPEPAHSLVLLWMDRFPVRSFELMIGLRVIGGRLVRR